ncbi:hypothetical protein [Nocardia nova]|uniref:hypothetical protein n=1 Tax=Nocardia nova TaxID=37330 RepID=UPI0021579496|nr:hypothetical protein [Nocardia nova]
MTNAPGGIVQADNAIRFISGSRVEDLLGRAAARATSHGPKLSRQTFEKCSQAGRWYAAFQLSSSAILEAASAFLAAEIDRPQR